ncbi:MAG TPA: hypothetical protein VEP46_07430 [Vicinamibacterales bacterium]|nr:hypothetical protein [Vicinamibacterales bacterium]
MLNRCTILIVACVVSACASAAQLPLSAGVGPQPDLPPPKTSVLPLVKVATAKGWPAGVKPIGAEGTTVAAFAQGLEHPRWLYVLPNGDVLVAETNAPPRPEDGKGIKGKFFKHYQKKAGDATPGSTGPSAWRWPATRSTWRMRIRWSSSRTRRVRHRSARLR